MGGQIVSHLAVEHPSLVSAVVAVDPGYGFAGPVADAFPSMIERMREDTVGVSLANDRWTANRATPSGYASGTGARSSAPLRTCCSRRSRRCSAARTRSGSGTTPTPTWRAGSARC
nr:hypothetical protein GCM10020093_101400 [Planobispora longispora]